VGGCTQQWNCDMVQHTKNLGCEALFYNHYDQVCSAEKRSVGSSGYSRMKKVGRGPLRGQGKK